MLINKENHKVITNYLHAVQRLLQKRKLILALTKSSEVAMYWGSNGQHINQFTQAASDFKLYLRGKHNTEGEYQLGDDKVKELREIMSHVNIHINTIQPSMRKGKLNLIETLKNVNEAIGRFGFQDIIKTKVEDVDVALDLVAEIISLDIKVKDILEDVMIKS